MVLFVYGTLMPGQIRWSVLEPHALSTEAAYAKGSVWDTGFGYPAARFAETGGEIAGVLVTVAPERAKALLDVLDGIEGEGVLFRRVEILTSRGSAVAYEWLGRTEGLLPLANGWPGL